MDKTIFPGLQTFVPTEKAFFKAWECQIAEMAGLETRSNPL